MAASKRNQSSAKLSGESDLDLSFPTHFRCPISLDLMTDPVTISTGITYDRRSIETWLDDGNRTCPVTNQALSDDELIPNHAIRRMIQAWCVANRALGVERIPTPRIPVRPEQVSEILSEISFAGRRGDACRCLQLVEKTKSLMKESERNRRCFVASGSGCVLSCAMGELARSSTSGAIFEEILGVLAMTSPLDKDSLRHLGAPKSVDVIVSIIKSGGLRGRLAAVTAVKELASSGKTHAYALAANDELVEALVKLVKAPISPQATKASLIAIYYLVHHDKKMAAKVAGAGLVAMLLEMLAESEKSTCEKSLAVLESVLECEEGREAARRHALVVPVLVKKMFRVSEMATEMAVLALWKVCKSGGRGGGREECLVEAVQVGAFQKLLLLLQVGCSGEAKEKATEMLKLLNGFKGKLECVDVVDLRGLRRLS